jgi:hypothetical protein
LTICERFYFLQRRAHGRRQICPANGARFSLAIGEYFTSLNAERMEDGGFAQQMVSVFTVLAICERF